MAGSNRLTRMPPLWDFTQLVDLYLGNNDLERVPRCVSRLRSLRFLFLDDNKRLSYLPSCLMRMPSLVTLSATGCPLMEPHMLPPLQQAGESGEHSPLRFRDYFAAQDARREAARRALVALLGLRKYGRCAVLQPLDRALLR